ncbi:hypothetical protein [Basilea psittacipulmonis]|uniref:hypothetical protein n=1 Tax=Basilea psittacipulmonis TaxID=1472345 RepID=UPI0013012257|nr:hypothetical protein [Basilea psittacipulmonis]
MMDFNDDTLIITLHPLPDWVLAPSTPSFKIDFHLSDMMSFNDNTHIITPHPLPDLISALPTMSLKN